MIAFVAMGIFFLAGCTKNTENASREMVVPGAPVQMRLVTSPQSAGALIQWQSGYLSASMLTVDGSNIVGNSMRLVQYTNATTQRIQLFHPTYLGTVETSPAFYNGLSFVTTLTSGQQFHAIQLNGLFRFANQYVPVQVLIDSEVLLSSIWLDNITISQGTTYNCILYFDPSQLMTGINAARLLDASRIDNTLVISANSNIDLYNIVMTNLNNGINVLFAAPNNGVLDTMQLSTPPAVVY